MQLVGEAEAIAKEGDLRVAVAKLNQLMEKCGDKKYGENMSKYVPQLGKSFSTPLHVIYEIATGLWHVYEPEPTKALGLAKALWGNGSREDRILAVNLLQKAAVTLPDETLSFVAEAVPQIANWEICDALAVRALGGVALAQQAKVLQLAEQYLSSDNKWTRRFATSMLVPLAREENTIKDILKLLCLVMKDKDSEVRQGASWLLREASKQHPKEVAAFLKLWLANASDETTEIARGSIANLPESEAENIKKMLKP